MHKWNRGKSHLQPTTIQLIHVSPLPINWMWDHVNRYVSNPLARGGIRTNIHLRNPNIGFESVHQLIRQNDPCEAGSKLGYFRCRGSRIALWRQPENPPPPQSILYAWKRHTIYSFSSLLQYTIPSASGRIMYLGNCWTVKKDWSAGTKAHYPPNK